MRPSARADGRDIVLQGVNPHFAAVVGHLAAAMKAAGVPDDIIGRAGAAVAATEPDIVEAVTEPLLAR